MLSILKQNLNLVSVKQSFVKINLSVLGYFIPFFPKLWGVHLLCAMNYSQFKNQENVIKLIILWELCELPKQRF